MAGLIMTTNCASSTYTHGNVISNSFHTLKNRDFVWQTFNMGISFHHYRFPSKVLITLSHQVSIFVSLNNFSIFVSSKQTFGDHSRLEDQIYYPLNKFYHSVIFRCGFEFLGILLCSHHNSQMSIMETGTMQKQKEISENIKKKNRGWAEGMPPTPFDPRFPNQNQTKNCYQNYVDYQRCAKIKGPDSEVCFFYKKAFLDICPMTWVEKWNDQIENGIFPSKI